MLLNATGQVTIALMTKNAPISGWFTNLHCWCCVLIGIPRSYHWNRCKTFVVARVSHNGMRGENVIYFTAASLMCLGFYYRQ